MNMIIGINRMTMMSGQVYRCMRLGRNYSEGMDRLEGLIKKIERNVGIPNSGVYNRDTDAQDGKKVSGSASILNGGEGEKHQSISRNNMNQQKRADDIDTIDLFSQACIVVGRIECVDLVEGSDKLYREVIDIGGETSRSVASGLRGYVGIDEMVGNVLVFANLKERKMAGCLSEGMVLCSSHKKGDKPQIELCRPHSDSKVGERVFPEGYEELFHTKVLPNVKPDKMMKILAYLSTDDEGCIIFDGKRLRTQSGYLMKSTLKNAAVS